MKLNFKVRYTSVDGRSWVDTKCPGKLHEVWRDALCILEDVENFRHVSVKWGWIPLRSVAKA